MTSLNLFASQFDSVAKFVEKKQKELEFVLVDTPGQIEVFTWSASGNIITNSLALTVPTCVLYVMDATRCISPATFMSNMLYACSILYKTRLPFVLCFNKCDAASSALPKEWMTDFEALNDALASDTNYMANLTRSMSLVLQEFYETLTAVSCSALTGEGIDEVIEAIRNTREDYEKEYLNPLKERMERKKKEQEENLGKVKADMGEEIRSDDDDDEDENEW